MQQRHEGNRCSGENGADYLLEAELSPTLNLWGKKAISAKHSQRNTACVLLYADNAWILFLNIIDVELIYNVVLISVVQQSDSVINTYIHIFHILFHYGFSQNIEYSSPYYTVGPCCLFILYIMVRKCMDSERKEPCKTPKFLCQLILTFRKYLLYFNA